MSDKRADNNGVRGNFGGRISNFVRVAFDAFRAPFTMPSSPPDPRIHVPVNPDQMENAERALYEANRYMAEEVSKVPFIGTPLVRLQESANCSAMGESLSPFQNSSPACQGTRDGRTKR